MITLSEKTRVIWFLPVTDACDFMGHIGLDENGKARFDYRFRHYGKSFGDPFLDDDVKNWYSVVPKEGDKMAPNDTAKLESYVRPIIEALASAAQGPLDEIRMGPGGIKEFMEEMRGKPWAFAKEVKDYDKPN